MLAAFAVNIDGMVFGEDPREGLVVGNRFRHPGFRIEVFSPEGWSIQNMAHAVAAKDPDHDFQLELNVHYLSKKTSVEKAARLIFQKIGCEQIAGSQQLINRLDAYVGTYAGRSRELGPVTAKIGFFLQRDKVYYISGIAKTEEFKKARPFFEKSIKSFKELSQQEANNIRPNRVRLHKVKKGQNLAGILREFGRAADEIKTAALLNAWDPENLPELKPAMVIKILKNE